MNTVSPQNDPQCGLDAIQLIQQLDLGPIKVKLMDADEGEGWSMRQVNVAELWYKRFLVLNYMYPDETIVPDQVVDTFWHYHILDTRKYADDCQHIFGRFLHHFPYFGMRGKEDANELERSFANSESLFLAEFGESFKDMKSAFADVMTTGNSAKCNAGNCRSCKNTADSDLARPVFVG